MKDFSKLCTPAKIYFAIAVIATIVALFNGATVLAAIMKLVFAFIWTYILSWLCDKGYKSLSWFLVLLPYIIILLAMLGVYRVTQSQKQLLNSIQLQGAYGQEAMTTAQKKVTKNSMK
jgi:predicted PurR-regulated permease PerM